MKLEFDETAKLILNILNSNGHKAYIVGGCVRDLIMGFTPKDYDIATSAKPEETLSIFDNLNYQNHKFKALPTGIKYGTITVITNHEPYEITTFRGEADYKDSRRPEKISFETSINKDLSRRDFTINAMAYNELDGLIDLFGGKNDINNKLIKCVGNPYARFKEDALRILRAYRFASRYNFNIEDSTLLALEKSLPYLLNISSERISSELKEIFENNYNIFKLPFMTILIPELIPCFDTTQNNDYHLYNVGEHTYKAFNNIEPIFHLKLAMLLHDIGKPQAQTTDFSGTNHFPGHAKISERMAVEIMQRLRLSNDTIHKVKTLIKYHDCKIAPDKITLKTLMRDIGYQLTADLIKVKIADEQAKNPKTTAINIDNLNEVAKLLKSVKDEPYSLNALDVNGNDIKIALQLDNGKKIGEILNYLLDIVIHTPELNHKDLLLKKAKDYYETN